MNTIAINTIDADELESLMEENEESRGEEVQLVDVLPPKHYKKVHLPGARNLPLKTLRDRAPEELNPDQPVVVYCLGPDCEMSPKAAQVLGELGFEEIYHFEGGVAEWRRSGREVVRNGE